MPYLYKHIRKDTNEVFYVGVGSDEKYSRAHTTHKRNFFWKKVVEKTDYDVLIVEDNKTWGEVTELEKFWISFYGRRNLNQGSLVNLTDGGEGSYGRKLNDETKKKIGEKSKLKTYDESYRKKLSEAFRGEKNHRFGIKPSEETKRKISESQLGQKHHFYGTNKPKEVKDKISKSQPTRKEVCKCDNDLRVISCYDSVGIASKENSISQGNLTTYLNRPIITKKGLFRKLGGYIWMYQKNIQQTCL
jgi:hypothetical protein